MDSDERIRLAQAAFAEYRAWDQRPRPGPDVEGQLTMFGVRPTAPPPPEDQLALPLGEHHPEETA